MSLALLCWQCGCPLHPGEVRRRNVSSGSTTGAGLFGGQAGVGRFGQCERVSLCTRCAWAHDRRYRLCLILLVLFIVGMAAAILIRLLALPGG